MDLVLAARGVAIGFTVAAAVGPISLLTVRRTIAHGRAYGLASGLGVATADATYAGIAAFGLTAITSLLVSGRTVLGILGGLAVVALGIRTIRSKPAEVASVRERPGLPAAYGSIFGLTMTNPMTILSFAAVFAGLGAGLGLGAPAGDPGDAGSRFGSAAVLTAGVFLGSSLWWLVLTGLVAWARERLTIGTLAWVNRLSGAGLVGFGLVALVLAVQPG